MNRIAERQNEERQIQRLAAQRALYAQAKRLMAWQFFLIVPITGVIAVVSVAFRDWELVAVAWAVLALAARYLYFEPRQEALRTEAARTQEAFDCDVLELDRRSSRTGPEPGPEVVAGAAREYERRGGHREGLKDWYAPAVADLPLHLARLVCQRQNCWWDGSLRRAYADWLLALLVGMTVLGLTVGALADWGVRECLLRVILPLVPLYELGLSERRSQWKAAERVDKLHQRGLDLWNMALAGLDPAACREGSRELQDGIYEHRAGTQPVPDVLYGLLRDRMNANMNEAAEDLIAEGLKRSTG
jgi:hypothetical protein